MANTSIWDMSTSAASNTSVQGVNIAENCAPSNLNDAMRSMIAQAKGAVTAVAASGTDTYTATLAPAPDALTDGMTIQVRFTNANTSTTPTLNINTLGAKTITKNGGSALVAGDIPAGHDAILRYVSASTEWQLMNPAGMSGPTSSTTGNVPKFSDTTGKVLEDGYGVGTSANDLVQLDSDAKLPAVDGSKLTNLAPQGYLAGLTLSNNSTTPNTKLDVASGICAADDASQSITLSSGITIDTSTTGTLGLDAGTLAASTVYHVFAISKDDGTTSALASTSVDSPTLPTGYTKQRRIGSFITDSSTHIRTFSQNGDEFLWSAAPLDISVTSLTNSTRTIYSLTVPTGVKVLARVRFNCVNSANTSAVALTSPDESDQGVTGGFIDLENTSGVTGASSKDIRTNTSGQIGVRSDTNNVTSFKLTTAGYIDTRGK